MATVPSPLISSSPDRLGGAAVFAGTRVPVQTLIEYLEQGHPLDQFLDATVSEVHAPDPKQGRPADNRRGVL